MGLGASRGEDGLCATVCAAERCPALMGGSPLQRREQYNLSRRQHTVAYLIKERTTGLSSEQTDGALAEVDYATGRLTQVGAQRLEQMQKSKTALLSSPSQAQVHEDRKPGGLEKVLDRRARANEELARGCTHGDLARVQRALAHGASTGTPDARGVTPLMLAASSSGKEVTAVVQEILKHKANLHEKDLNGWRSLHHACRNGKTAVVKLLQEAHVDLTATTTDGKTGLILAVIEGKLELVCELLKIREFKQMLTDKDVTGYAAIHYAVKDGYLDICKQLIDKAAKVNSKDVEGRSPLSLACEFGRGDCVRLLCKKQADIDVPDRSRRSPLLYAVLHHHEQIALWLLTKKGADPHQEDASKDTPMSLAEELGLMQFRTAVKQQHRRDGDNDGEEEAAA